MTRQVVSVVPKDVKDVVESRRRGLLLEPLKKLKAGNSIFINSDNFTISFAEINLAPLAVARVDAFIHLLSETAASSMTLTTSAG